VLYVCPREATDKLGRVDHDCSGAVYVESEVIAEDAAELVGSKAGRRGWWGGGTNKLFSLGFLPGFVQRLVHRLSYFFVCVLFFWLFVFVLVFDFIFVSSVGLSSSAFPHP